MNNNLQLVLKSSTTEMSLNDHSAGIYLTPELDGLTGLPEIRTTSGVNAGYDGGWTSAQKFDARSIVIRGTIANNDKTEVERMRRELVALLAQGKNEQLELDFVTETGRAYEVQVRTIACDMALQKVLTQQDFMITLRADDPLIYDNSSAGEEATVNISGATGGFRIPFEIPLAIDAGSEETLVENTGLEAVAPTVKMYGALHNPKIINHTTNQSMQIQAELGFAEGAWINPADAPEGTNVTFNPEMDAPIESVKLKGDTYQQKYTGKNLYDVSTLVPGTYVTADSEGWITINRDNSAGSSAVYPSVWTSNLTHLATSTRYDVFMEVKSVSGDGGELAVTSTASGSGQFDSWQIFQITSLSAGTVYVKSPVTKSSFSGISNGLRTTLTLPAGKKCSITFRLSVLANGAETTSTFSYEPYVNNAPAPSPAYPQAIQVVTGEQTIKIHGKNLFDNSSAVIGKVWNGVSNNKRAYGYIEAAQDQQYSVSTQNTDSDLAISVVETTAIGETINPIKQTTLTNSLTFTPQAGTKFIAIQFSTTNNLMSQTIVDNAKVQIELGSSASQFEPYQGQSYEVNLGKNLFDKDNATQYRYISDSNGSITTSTNNYTYAGESYIPCDPNTAYTLSGGSQYMRIAEYTSDKTFVKIVNSQTSSSPITITTGNSGAFLRVSYNDTSLGDADIQLEKGSTATSYAAYFTPIELCKIGTYQDYIYKSGDKWYVHKEVGKALLNDYVDTASRGTTNASNKYRFRFAIPGILPAATVSTKVQSYCSHLTAGTVGNTYSRVQCIAIDVGSNNYVFMFSTDTEDMTLDDFKTWLTGKNISFYYPLATATDTEITNAALIAQLEALVDGTAKVYAPVTYISVSSAGDLPNIFAARYYTGKNPDQRDELIIDSRLRTITLNGLDVYHLQAPGSEFLMLAPGENKLSLQSDIVGDNGYAKVSYKQGYLSI